MCGIAGFVGEGDRDSLHKMVRKLQHRGPDDEGFVIVDNVRVFLGHRRLSIVDLSAPAQPMWDHQGQACISYNGEVYNHLEIREELEREGHVFSTRTDTEVVLGAYLKWGADCLEKLNGMFALAIYDKRNGDLFLARDRFGKKPLYYTQEKDNLAFSSELTSLMTHPKCPRDIDADAVRSYFVYNSIIAPATILRGVYKLPPGHRLLWNVKSRGNPQVSRWYRFNISPSSSLSFEDAKSEFAACYGRALKRRLMSDVPLGVFLSGGMDSTSVVEGLCSQGIKPTCYSIGFEEKSFDESGQAAETASYYGVEHKVKMVKGREVEDNIEVALSALDEPMGDASILPTYLLCKFAREEVTVAIGGDGSDELFAGYDPFKAIGLSKALRPLLSSSLFRMPVLKLASLLPTRHGQMTFEFRLRRWLRAFEHEPAHWMAAWMSSVSKGNFPRLFPGAQNIDPYFSAESAACYQNASLEEGSIYYYLHAYLTDSVLCKVDRASMKVSLEVRAPFLDIELANFLETLPYEMRFRSGIGKRLLRSHLEGKVPESVLQRPKKGFGMPVAKWIVGPLRDKMEEALKSDFLEEMGMDRQAVQQLWKEHLSYQEDQRAFLWNLLVLRDWKNRVA